MPSVKADLGYYCMALRNKTRHRLITGVTGDMKRGAFTLSWRERFQYSFNPDEPILRSRVQGKYKMEEEAAKYAKELLKGAKAAGFNMQLCSAYRTIETSERLYKNKVNDIILQKIKNSENLSTYFSEKYGIISEKVYIKREEYI